MTSINPTKAVGFVVAIAMIALLVGVLMPPAIGAFYGDTTATYNTTVGETYQVVDTLNLTVDSVDTTAGAESATITLADGTDTQTLTVNEGSNSTFTIQGEDIVVTTDDVVDTSTAIITLEYPKTYAWADGTVALFSVIPLLIVLVVFLFIVGAGVLAYKGK